MAGNKKPNVAIRIRSLQSMPSGYMLGRTSPGVGPVELVPLSGGAGNDVGSRLVAGGTVQGIVSEWLVMVEYVLVGGLSLDVNQFYYMGFTVAKASWPSVNLIRLSKAFSRVAPLINCSLYLVNNYTDYVNNGFSTSNVAATIDFTAGNTNATINWSASPLQQTIDSDTPLYLFTSPTFTDKVIEGIQLLFVGDYING